MTSERKTLIWLAVVCLVLQVGIAPYIAIAGVVPNFMLLPAVSAGIVEGRKAGCIMGFICGLAYDLVGTGPFGCMMIVLLLVGYLSAFAAQNMLSSNWLITILVLLAAAFVAEFSEAALLAIVGTDTSFAASFVLRVLPGTVYDTVFGFACFPILRRRLHLVSSSSRPGDGRTPVEVKNINLH